MFDLEAAILDWRGQMRRAGLDSPAVLDELESHLRADIEQQIQGGVTMQNAFTAACARMGQAALLQREFSALNPDHPARSPIAAVKAKMIFAAAAAGLILSLTAWLVVRSQMLPGFQLSPGAQAFTLAGFAVFEFVLLAWLWKVATRPSAWSGTGSFLLDGFSMPAQQSFAAARQEAMAFRHDFIGTEHLLLGLLQEQNGIVARVVGGMGLTVDKVREEILNFVGPGEPEILPSDIPYTPRARRALALAANEARKLPHGDKIGPEHVLLGLLLEGDGVASRVLRNLRVETSAARREILKAIGPSEK
jgi:hypothetical protein